jgi:uncharacterized protein (TIGR00299 family) protein
MVVGAALDAGVPLALLREAVASLDLGGVDVSAERVTRGGVTATKFLVRLPGHGASAPTRHRHLRDILALIDRSGLPPGAKARASALFVRLGEAEAAVHDVPVDRVHFHEVGAVDSIVDVVCGVLALDWLAADRIVASPLNTGRGTVETAHGTLPVPAPATARLVSGVPVYADGPEAELLTPTGALLVTGHASAYGPLPPMRLERVGYGAGDRDLPGRPNVLRAFLGEAMDEIAAAGAAGVAGTAEAAGGGGASASPESGGAGERLAVIACEIDDLNPQILGSLLGRLLETGAVDAYYTPVQMKKCRPGTLVTVLAPPDRREAVAALLFRETTTLGVRYHEVWREALARELVAVDTPWGPVRVKVARRGGAIVNAMPEFDDCDRLARERDVPVKDVQAAALGAWSGRLATARAPARPPLQPAASRTGRGAEPDSRELEPDPEAR